MDILFLATLTAAGYIIILSKMLTLRTLIRHQVATDIVATGGIPWLFYGSFSGMAVAIVAGLIVSIFLYIAGKILTATYIIR